MDNFHHFSLALQIVRCYQQACACQLLYYLLDFVYLAFIPAELSQRHSSPTIRKTLAFVTDMYQVGENTTGLALFLLILKAIEDPVSPLRQPSSHPTDSSVGIAV